MSVGSPTETAVWTGIEEGPSPLSVDDRVLVISAHPDDETIGAGRLLAGHEAPVCGLTLTLGEHCVPALDPAEMGRRRYAEWQRALDLLGVRPLRAARWPDGCLSEHEDDVADLLSVLAADFDVLVCPWRHDPHPDHEAAGRACAVAAEEVGSRLVEYPVWAPCWTPQARVVALDYEAVALTSTPLADRARERAIAAYPSQTVPLLPAITEIVPQWMLERHPTQLVMERR